MECHTNDGSFGKIGYEKFAKQEFDKYYIKNGIQVSNKVSFMACMNDISIGVIIANIFESEAYINSLIVSEEYRGLGIGAELLQKVEEHCRNNGVKLIALHTYRFEAPDFYKKHGYIQEGLTKHISDRRLDRFYFVKYLDSR